jgi:CheY-like chemotaxis protein
LSLELAPDLSPTYADSDQIQQIIINLLNNSLQAMMDMPPPRRLKIRTQMQKDILQISVEDNGPGVPPDLESKIFEPFFTTKEVGTGTGLGLSIAHSILMEHRGKIFYQTSSLGGAGFFLEIPVVTVRDKSHAETDTVQITAPPPAPEISPAQILVLDDEKSIAELLCEMLSMLGHHPTLCLNPPQALELIETRNFDLILSDFRMPFMNGQEFYQRVAEKNQSVANRIIFLTGDVVNEETQSFLKSTGNPHLAKPFQLANLQVVIAETLAKGQLTPAA